MSNDKDQRNEESNNYRIISSKRQNQKTQKFSYITDPVVSGSLIYGRYAEW